MIHGHAPKHAHSPTYRSWSSMIQRCANPNRTIFKRYGGRGISVVPSWCRFENFLADMGERPAGTTLERMDNDANYGPDNCCWATATQQARNSSQTVRVTIDGVTKALLDWCDEFKISAETVRSRHKKQGWDWVKALTTPRQTASDRGGRGRFKSR